MLEIAAQIMALVALQDLLPEAIWCWIDNTAGESALRKGYGRDRKVNRLLTMLWTFLAKKQLDPHWRRVKSSANISDPISREDLSLAHSHHWLIADIPENKIYKTLVRGVKSMDAAVKAADDLLSLGAQSFRCESMVSAGSRTTMVQKGACQQCDLEQLHTQKDEAAPASVPLRDGLAEGTRDALNMPKAWFKRPKKKRHPQPPTQEVKLGIFT